MGITITIPGNNIANHYQPENDKIQETHHKDISHPLNYVMLTKTVVLQWQVLLILSRKLFTSENQDI